MAYRPVTLPYYRFLSIYSNYNIFKLFLLWKIMLTIQLGFAFFSYIRYIFFKIQVELNLVIACQLSWLQKSISCQTSSILF